MEIPGHDARLDPPLVAEGECPACFRARVADTLLDRVRDAVTEVAPAGVGYGDLIPTADDWIEGVAEEIAERARVYWGRAVWCPRHEWRPE